MSETDGNDNSVTESHVSGISKEERTWGMVSHLSALSGVFTGGLGGIVGPLIVWMIKKEEMPFVDEQGKEALNFQITMLIAGVVSFLLMIVVIGFFLLIAVGIFDFVMVLIASFKANEGEHYRYPVNFRLIK